MTVFSLDLHPADGLVDLVDHTTGDTAATLRLGQSPFGDVEVHDPEAWEAFKAGGEPLAELLDALRLNVVDPSQAPDPVVRLAYDLRRLERRLIDLEDELEVDGGLEKLRGRVHDCANAAQGAVMVVERVGALEAWKEETERIKQRRYEAWSELSGRAERMLEGEGGEE